MTQLRYPSKILNGKLGSYQSNINLFIFHIKSYCAYLEVRLNKAKLKKNKTRLKSYKKPINIQELIKILQ